MPLLSRLTREEDLRRSKGEPYRLLEAVPAISHGDPATENMLIQCEATGTAWHFSLRARCLVEGAKWFSVHKSRLKMTTH